MSTLGTLKSRTTTFTARAGVDVLERILRLAGQDGYRYVAEALHARITKRGFQIAGIHYQADPCSVGRTPMGEGTGVSAAEMIRERGLTDLRVLDLCSGVGIVGLTMLSNLTTVSPLPIRSMTFADINIFNLTSVRKTLRQNQSSLPPVDFDTCLSDCLRGIVPGNQFDIIISNPPHCTSPSFSEVVVDPHYLGSRDPDWTFHREFYAGSPDYLAEDGEIWFLEYRKAASEEELTRLIAANPQLELVTVQDDRRDPNYFWMITRRSNRLQDLPT